MSLSYAQSMSHERDSNDKLRNRSIIRIMINNFEKNDRKIVFDIDKTAFLICSNTVSSN